MRKRLLKTFHLFPAVLADTIRLTASQADRAAKGLWDRDPSVWSADPAAQQKIANRFGWLSSPRMMADSIDRLRSFAAKVKDDGMTDVVLLGMGGSSLAPEVLRTVLGIAPGWPRFRMLDSTDPAAVLAAATPPATTLYILASKSGTTIEPNSLAAHFRERLEQAGIVRWADHFVAITDEGTALAARARTEGFRDLFINPSDIGGRYSALSFFGLLPAALMNQDVAALVDWGAAMIDAAMDPSNDPTTNPAVGLGLAIAAAARSGRDKLTLLLPPAIEPFGLWVEQLIAESTGKEGKGVVPIAGETIAPAHTYGLDRFFVLISTPDARAGDPNKLTLDDLPRANAPVVTLDLAEPAALGAEFVRWEIATAVAGALLGINPFDEPNVQQAKDATGGLLKRFQSEGRLPKAEPDVTLQDGATLILTTAARQKLGSRRANEMLSLLTDGDYLAILAYLGPDQALADRLQMFRMEVRDRTRSATMLGYGPRYLHSTGQLHKGGPNTGVFVVFTATPLADVDIPGEPFTFGTLELAQALGDFASLDTAGRRALHVHLPAPDPELLRRATATLLEALPTREINR